MKKRYFISIFRIESSNLNFDGFFIFICRIIITSITTVLGSLVCFFALNLSLYSTITSNVNGASMRKFQCSLCLFYPAFLWLKLAIHRIGGEVKGPSLFFSSIFVDSRTFRHLLVVLHMK